MGLSLVCGETLHGSSYGFTTLLRGKDDFSKGTLRSRPYLWTQTLFRIKEVKSSKGSRRTLKGEVGLGFKVRLDVGTCSVKSPATESSFLRSS